jgi:dTDP-4-dehydrorhamnose 3,5-epimerase-like enzyme
MSDFTVLELPGVNDARGGLTVLEKRLPFDIQRVYWIYNAAGQTRGGHRHHVTRQALVAVSGEISVHMCDGKHRQDIVLNTPAQCLLVEPEDWHTMTFGKDAVLLVMASHTYDKNDYISESYP